VGRIGLVDPREPGRLAESRGFRAVRAQPDARKASTGLRENGGGQRLDEKARTVLQSASYIADSFDATLLAELSAGAVAAPEAPL
jgi:hypothetical protein